MLLIRQVAEYIVGGGGKRLRPCCCCLSAGAFGYAGRTATSSPQWSSSSTPRRCCTTTWWTRSDLRRGQATANSQFGNAAAVLVGDFVYSRAFQMMMEGTTCAYCGSGGTTNSCGG